MLWLEQTLGREQMNEMLWERERDQKKNEGMQQWLLGNEALREHMNKQTLNLVKQREHLNKRTLNLVKKGVKLYKLVKFYKTKSIYFFWYVILLKWVMF